MARNSLALLAALLLVTLAAAPRAQEKTDEKATPAADGPGAPAGKWKIILPMLRGAGSRPVWLLELAKNDKGWTGKVLASGQVQSTANRWPKAALEGLNVAGEQMRFTLKTTDLSLPCTVRMPKDGKTEKLYGSAVIGKDIMPIELEKTELSDLEAFDQLKESLAKQQPGHQAISIALTLLNEAEGRKAKPAEVRAWAEKAVKSAELYGPEYQRETILDVAKALLTEQKGFEAIALQYARRAERLLEPKEPPAVQKKILEVLAAALERSGKEADAKEIAARLKKLDFRVKTKPYIGRKGKSDRAVLVELFTGAQCPPCVAADKAFDALGRTFKPSEVVLLQYHLHVPGPDPLTNADTEARSRFYEEAIRGTPTILFDGKPGAPGGGGEDDATEKYEEFLNVVEPLLEKPAKAELKLSANRKGDKVTIDAEVANLGETGDDIRLRLVLVEEQVAYKGGNGLPIHHHVVRAMPGGDAGTVMKDKATKKTFTVDIAELRKKLKAYLDKYNEKRPFPGKDWPLEMKNLKVIAFVQNDKNLELLQAVQVDVAGGE
jgi:hypothetical protein